MKHIYVKILTLTLLLISGVTHGQNINTEWNEANTAYINAKYDEAIDQYEAILKQGVEHEKLYFNLGNAYFKKGMNAKAILNYNRAQKLAPSDEDVAYNLSIANRSIQDIDVVPTLFINRIITQIRESLSSNGWAILSLLFLICTMASLFLYLIFKRIISRKIGFYGTIVSIGLMICTITFSNINRNGVLNPTGAIVMSNSAPVKSSPDQSSKDLFVLHDGTKVIVKETLNDYSQIVLSDGNKGWILTSAIELI